MAERMLEARGMVRRLLEQFVDDGDSNLKDEVREGLEESGEFSIEDEWGDYDTNYDSMEIAVDEIEELATKIVKGMLKEMRNW